MTDETLAPTPNDGPGTVYLVGAGPGDPDLLTLRAHRLLQQCDALVYDSLVPTALLDLVPQGCERHFVGKRRGHHSVPQPSTNAVLRELAGRRRLIVRLKGGDPFLFGRGGEEAAHLAAHGIPVQVVPGVTAGIAAPAYAGIPVTHRRAGSSVTFVTGHEEIDKRRPGVDWRGARLVLDLKCRLPRPPLPPLARQTVCPSAARSATTSPLLMSVNTVPTGTRMIRSSPPLP
jgi:uroporphyrin-III C-methyltransferase